MARFERFEVKNEMKDIHEINPDEYKNTGGRSTYETRESVNAEANRVGFDDAEYFGIEEYKDANLQVEQELIQYYNDEVTQEQLKAYLISKITEIYGEELNQCNILVDSLVEGFLENYEFTGAKSYRQLTNAIEESIINIESKKRR